MKRNSKTIRRRSRPLSQFFSRFSTARYRRKLRNFSLALLVVTATFVSLLAFVFFQKVSKSIASASAGLTLNGGINLKGRVNLLLAKVDEFDSTKSLISDLMILSLETGTKRGGLYRLPVDLEVGDLGGFGQGKLASLYGLSQITAEKDPSFLTRQVQAAVLVPIEGFILINDHGYRQALNLFGADLGFSRFLSGDYLYFFSKLPQALGLLADLRTNLSAVNLIEVFRQLISTGFTDFEVTTLEAASIDRHPDAFLDRGIEDEGKKITILNGTKVPLLAARVAQMISNLGGTVLEAANAPGESYDKSAILVRDQGGYTLNKMAQVLGISEIRTFDAFVEDSALAPFLRVDFIIILGLDYVSSK